MKDIPLEELKELLAARFSEVELLEVFDIDASMLVHMCADYVEENPDKFTALLDEIGVMDDDTDDE